MTACEIMVALLIVSVVVNVGQAIAYSRLGSELRRERAIADVWNSRHVQLAKKLDELRVELSVRRRWDEEA